MNETDRYFQVMFDYIESVYPLSEGDKDSCKRNMHSMSLSKDSYISEEGKIPKYHNFVVSGHVRNYHIDDNGEEVTIDLNDGPRFFTSFSYYIDRTASSAILRTLEFLSRC